MAVVIARLSKKVGEAMMSDLYSALQDNKDHIQEFLQAYPTVYMCKKRMHDIVNLNMEHFGYDKIDFTVLGSKMSDHVYLRDAAHVLRHQLSQDSEEQFQMFPSKHLLMECKCVVT